MPRESTASRLATLSRSSQAPLPLHQVVAIAAVLVLAPITALLVANVSLTATLVIASAFAVLLIVLWSAEASFYILIFSMLLSPEFIAADLAGAQGRGLTLRFDDYLIVMIGLAWLVRVAVFKEAGVLRKTPLNWPIFIYLSVCAVSTAVGALVGNLSPLTGFLFVAKYFEYTVVYFLVVNFARGRPQVQRLLFAAIATAVIISVIAILQIPGGGRVSAPFEGESGEPNTLGGYLVLMIAVALAFLSESRTNWERIVWGILALLMTVPLVYTFSRTSWLAFCAMLLALTAICRRKTVFIGITAALLIVFLISPPQAIIERAAHTVATASSGGTVTLFGYTIEPSAAARLQSWFLAAEALSIRPLLGWGVTGYAFVDSQFTRTLIETGVLGLAALLYLLWRLYRVGAELLRKATHSFDIALATGFSAGVFAVLAHGIGSNTFIIVRIMEPFWLLAALVVTLLLDIEAEEDAAAESEREPTAGRPGRPVYSVP